MDLQIPINILSIFAGVGITAAGIGFAYSQFSNGGSKAKDDLISTLRETAAAEKEKAERLAVEKQTIITSHQQQINDLTEKVGKLQGLYQASDQQKKEYLTILQGMSPDEIQYRKEMREFTAGVALYMKNSAEVFEGMKGFMVELSANSKKGG